MQVISQIIINLAYYQPGIIYKAGETIIHLSHLKRYSRENMFRFMFVVIYGKILFISRCTVIYNTMYNMIFFYLMVYSNM